MIRTILTFFALFMSYGLLYASTATLQNFSDCTKSGCHLSQMKHSNIHPPLEDGCGTCHEAIESEHPVENETEFKLIESLPDLCLQCHEFDGKNTNVHNPVREGDCTGCHNPHSSENEMLLIAENSELCATCHEVYSGKDFIHGPVAGGMCTACHDPHYSEHQNLLKRDGQEVCLFCHTAKKEIQAKLSVHKPFQEGCMQCHTPHHSPAKFLLNTDVPELCYKCHQTVEVGLAKKSEVHGPFQKGGKCYICHDAHVSDFEPLLQDVEQNLCLTCHDKKIKKGERNIKNIGKSVNAKNVHAPVTESGCSACHAAHTPDNFFLLSAAYPTGSYSDGKKENFAHCFDCHDPALMEEVETTDATSFRDGTKNLHYVHVTREKSRNCTTCHDIHGSKYTYLVAEKVPFGKWEMPMKFLVTGTGGSCLTGCHKKLSYSRDQKK